MENDFKQRIKSLTCNIWIFLAVYLVLIAGPDYLPRIFIHHDQAPLELGSILSALAGYLFIAAPLFTVIIFPIR